MDAFFNCLTKPVALQHFLNTTADSASNYSVVDSDLELRGGSCGFVLLASQILTTVNLTRTNLTKQRSHSQEKAAMTQESVTLVNKLRRSKTCLILQLTRWTVRGVVDGKL